jgi:hypothetical protein
MLKDSAVRAEMSLVTITTGLKASFDAGSWLVPKKELVGVLQMLLQSRRIRVAETLPEAGTRVKELENFRAKVAPSSTSDLLADWRDAPHDDLVLAVVVAAWYAECFHSYAKCAYQERRGGGGDRPLPARAVAGGQIPSQRDGRGQGGLPAVFAGISSCLGRCDPTRATVQEVRQELLASEGIRRASSPASQTRTIRGRTPRLSQGIPSTVRAGPHAPEQAEVTPDERAGVCCREVADARPGVRGR